MNTNDEGATARAKVFISYAASDREVAEQIALVLRSANFDVWFDSWQLQASDSITAKVRAGLSTSDFLLVLLSPDSVNSRWVSEELTVALSEELRQRAITVVPILLRDCDVPSELQDHLRVDLRRDYDHSLSVLVDMLRSARDVNFARLNPRVFEALVTDLFRAEGYTVTQSLPAHDGGHDLLLTTPQAFGLASAEPFTIAVQVKHYRERRVSVQTIREAVGSLVLAGQRTTGLIVCSSQLTSAARELVSDINAKGIVALDVIDGPQLERRVLQHPDVVDKFFRQEGAE